jgi:hypothetical protein
LGAFPGSIVLPGNAAFTSFQFASAGSLPKLSGSLPAGDHGPLRSPAFNQASSFLR